MGRIGNGSGDQHRTNQLSGRWQFNDDHSRALEKLAIMPIGRGIFGGAIVKIPETHQARFIARKYLEHVFTNLFGSAFEFPNANFIHLTMKRRVPELLAPIGFTQIIVLAILESRKGSRGGIGADELTVEIELHPGGAANSSDMTPLVHLQHARALDALPRGGPIDDREANLRARSGVREIDRAPLLAEIKKTRKRAQLSPFDPALDGSCLKVIENFARQLDVAAISVELQDPILSGGEGRQSRQGNHLQNDKPECQKIEPRGFSHRIKASISSDHPSSNVRSLLGCD